MRDGCKRAEKFYDDMRQDRKQRIPWRVCDAKLAGGGGELCRIAAGDGARGCQGVDGEGYEERCCC